MIYVVAGHSVMDAGAIGIGGNNESEMTRSLRNLIVGYMKREDVSIDDDSLSTGDVVRWLRNRAKADTIVLDIHFNSFTTASANGTESFTTDSAKSLGKQINDATVKALGTTNRGLKEVSQTARGKIGILTLPCKVVLLEVCFISNKSDYDKYIANADKLARELALILDKA